MKSWHNLTAESLGETRIVSRRPAIRCISSVNATAWENFAVFWIDKVAADCEADLLMWEGSFEVWLGNENTVEPMTDFAAFFGCKPELLLTTVNDMGTGSTLDSLASEVMERCHLLPESVGIWSIFIGDGRWGETVVTKVVVMTPVVVALPVVVMTHSSSEPKSLGPWAAWRDEKVFLPFAEAPVLIAWKWSQ